MTPPGQDIDTLLVNNTKAHMNTPAYTPPETQTQSQTAP